MYVYTLFPYFFIGIILFDIVFFMFDVILTIFKSGFACDTFFVLFLILLRLLDVEYEEEKVLFLSKYII